jgi:signal transduction protein with GAF and PtsI domain
MNVYLRDKLLQKLDSLSDERGYQVLDYVEFLESKYAERATVAAAGNPLTRFADAVEERLRAGKVSATAVAETMGLMNRAMGVLSGAAAAGKSVANDLMSATSRVVDAATTAANAPASPRTGDGPTAGSGTTAATGGGTAGSSTTPGGTPPTAGN